MKVSKLFAMCFGFSLVFFSQYLLAAPAEDNIKKMFAKLMPGTNPESIKPSAIKGLYEVVFGAQVVYVSADGRYVLQGDIMDLNKRENLTEKTRSKQRLKLVENIPEKSMIVFEPKKTKHTVTVFTDVDCTYCRKLHNEMQAYLDEGIRVRYLAFPRTGVNSKSYYKAVTVWCADDKQKAMTDAKAGNPMPRKDCDNPVKQHMDVAEQFGVTGTPTIIMENGDVIPGYVPAERLAGLFNQAEK